MAFQQPQQRPQAARQLSIPKTVPESQVLASPARKRSLQESQEWILFSPAQQGYNESTASQTARTATHLSDFGSLETHIRSQPLGSNGDAGDATCQGTTLDDDEAELDSLDDGLHAFHHHPFSASSIHQLDQSGGTVLPTHDGLGGFPSSAGLQEHLWQFERHNPHRKRHVRRRSSLQRRIDEVEEEQEHDREDERTARIEKWRLEQSKAVLEEIERETRRRRRRMSRMSGDSGSEMARTNTLQSTFGKGKQRADSVIPEEPEPEPEMVRSVEQPPSESWWQRITRRVIQDLIGLDETTLSVIFGEDLVADPSPTPTQTSPLATAASRESRVTFRDRDDTWEFKLLERIARELGVLVHQLSETEGAFSTYKRAQDEPEYAGLPILRPAARQPSLRQQRRRSSDHTQVAPADSLFAPTMQQPLPSPTEADTSLWGIEEEPSHPSAENAEAAKLRQEQEYWERDLDVNVIFSYLKRHFSSRTPPPSPSGEGLLPASWATNTASAFGTSPESIRRAEVIRRQHPLVSRAAERSAAQARRRESLLKRHHMQTLMQRRAGSSSCASQSTKRSRRTKSGSYSERHYWDLGGSVGSVGSGPALSNSALGGWGEV